MKALPLTSQPIFEAKHICQPRKLADLGRDPAWERRARKLSSVILFPDNGRSQISAVSTSVITMTMPPTGSRFGSTKDNTTA
jgi:hypothetical protein